MASLHVRRIPIMYRIYTALFGYGRTFDWALAYRCRHCDFGRYHGLGEYHPCPVCWTPAEHHVLWVGRKVFYDTFQPHVSSYDAAIYQPKVVQHEGWEWVPEDELPEHLRMSKPKLSPSLEALVRSEVQARIDAEFEARVKAAVEVALTDRLSGR